MKHDLTDLIRESARITAELAHISEVLAGARYARRQVRDRIAAACVRGDEDARKITFWRPMTAAELVELDAVHARTAPVLAEMQPRETALKEALRRVRIAIDEARTNPTATRQTPGKHPAKILPGSDPPKGGETGTCRVLPGRPGRTRQPEISPTLSAGMGAQGELF